MKIIISGHGNYADGIISGVEMIIGKSELIALNFNDQTTLDEYKGNANKLIDNEGTIVLCDLFGGTPFQVFATLQIENPNVQVLCGINNGAIIENYFKKETMSLTDLAELLLTSSHEAIQKFVEVELVEDKVVGGGI